MAVAQKRGPVIGRNNVRLDRAGGCFTCARLPFLPACGYYPIDELIADPTQMVCIAPGSVSAPLAWTGAYHRSTLSAALWRS
jgi:hypothetical protein